MTRRRGVEGPSWWTLCWTICFFCGGSFSCRVELCGRDLLPALWPRGRYGELVALGMLASGARGRVVDMAKGSCGEGGGMNTTVAIHNDDVFRVSISKVTVGMLCSGTTAAKLSRRERAIGFQEGEEQQARVVIVVVFVVIVVVVVVVGG
jgi:hypothetical protein